MKLQIQRISLLASAIFCAGIASGQATFEKHDIGSPTGPVDVYTEDINADGFRDIVIVTYPLGETSWWENNAGTGFTKHVVATRLTGARCVRAGDIDGDGDIDMVAAAVGINKIEWYENDGNQIFSKHVVDANFGGAHTLELVDLDKDSDTDILCSGWNNTAVKSEIAWWENNGNQGFTKRVVSNTVDQSPFVAATDADLDGDLDLIASDETPGEIYLFKNDGQMHFAQIEIDQFSMVHTILPRDLDRDGDPDLLVGASTGQQAWYENDGNGDFKKNTLPNLLGGMWLDMGDFDLDGDEDMVGAGTAVSRLALYSNNGNQSFSKSNISGVISGGFALNVADMDNDQDLDIVAIGFQTNSFAWWENKTDRMALLDGPAWIVPAEKENEFFVSNPEKGNVILCQDQEPKYGLASGPYREGMLAHGDLLWVTEGPYLKAYDQFSGILQKQIRTLNQLLSVMIRGDAGDVYVSAPLDGKVFQFDPDIESMTLLSDQFDYPRAIRWDPLSNKIIVSDGEETVTIKSLNPNTGDIQMLNTTSIAAGGDLVSDGIGNWYISSPVENIIYSIVSDLQNTPQVYRDALQGPWGMYCDTTAKELLVVMNSGNVIEKIPATATGVESFHQTTSLYLRAHHDQQSGEILVQVIPCQPGMVELLLLTLTGKVIYHEALMAVNSEPLNIHWSLSSVSGQALPQSIYMICVMNGRNKASVKVPVMQ